MQDFSALEKKSLVELREIAKALGLKKLMVKKRDLIDKIIEATQTDASGDPDAKQQVQNNDVAPRNQEVKDNQNEEAPQTEANVEASDVPSKKKHVVVVLV